MTSAQDMLNALWRDVQQTGMEAEERAAKADPAAYRLSRVMERGRPLRYVYYGPVKGRGRETRYCWSVHRNVAGFYLGWREVVTPKAVMRDQFTARRVKQRLIELADRRLAAHRGRLAKAAVD